MSVVVRFAPSPTGTLHVGGARTALFNYYFAKHHGGSFLLRIEDTDLERSKKEHEKEILTAMKWLGMNWQGDIVYQSKRFDRYNQVIDELLEKDRAYRCYCTVEDIEKMREEARALGKKPKYDSRCRHRADHPNDQSYIVRLKSPQEGHTVVNDLIKGEVVFKNEELDDFVIRRSDQSPTYHLSVVVDDLDSGITHVIRGDDHLNNTPKQMFIFSAMDKKVPYYAHLPMILGVDKKKLSKRHGASAVTDYQKMGVLPGALRNALMRLGWSYQDKELFSDQELTDYFDIDGCNASPSVFDIQKLGWFNNEFLKKLSNDELLKLLEDFGGPELKIFFERESSAKLFEALKERALFISEFVEGSTWARFDQFEVDPKAVRDVLRSKDLSFLKPLRDRIEKLESERVDGGLVFQWVKEVAEGEGLKMAQVAKPLRVLLTGTLKSPDMQIVLESLGKTKILKRINGALV